MNRFGYQIYKTCITEGLIRHGDKIIVSLSGGIDSMSLCCLLSEFREKIDLELHWVHFNHGLRSESENEALFIRDLSRKKGIPVSIIKTDRLSGQKDMQNKARQWRYENLNRIMIQQGFDKIALGHHLNDLTETQIWRMLRGGSLFSFNPIQMKGLPYIRPLIHTPKRDLEKYLNEINQDWCEDASNSGSDYTRNLIRNELMPILQACAGGKLEEKLLALDHDARLLKEFFQEQVPEEHYQCDSLQYSQILTSPPLFACELIHRYLIYHGQTEINRANVELIFKQIKSKRGNWSIDLKEGVQISGHHKLVTIGKKL
ncbi:MAG: tRNA lysidine(34) synthetase TilS [Deltaproteobacteria bacterium]|nr:tRNA lysidine(34) synthetase TilS [Deltaproteobacteria bacterium]